MEIKEDIGEQIIEKLEELNRAIERMKNEGHQKEKDKYSV